MGRVDRLVEVRGDGDTRAFGPEARREWISDEVLREGYVSAREIADRFGVSVMTVYRDLDELEERRILRRERGGATAQPSSVFESDVRYRILRCVREKEALCQRALEEVSPGEAVMFDDSTTILPLARAVGERAPLTVMTNFRLAIEAALGKRGCAFCALAGSTSPPTIPTPGCSATGRSPLFDRTCSSPLPQPSTATAPFTRSRKSYAPNAP